MENKQRYIFSALVISVVALFMGTSFYMERTLESWVEDRIASELHENAKTLESLLSTLEPQFTVEALDPLVDSVTENSTHRITLIKSDGTVIADSSLNQAQIEATDNHSDRPELFNATQSKPGLAVHYSTAVKYDMMYLAIPYQINQNEGFVRVAISLAEVESYLDHFRKIYLAIAILGSILLVVILLYAFRYIEGLHDKNELGLVAEVKEKTNELVKIQKLSQILSSCQERDELAEVITSTALTIFPGTSGALSITHPSMDQNEVITSWGENWDGEELYKPTDCWAFRQGSTYLSHSHGLELECKHLNSHKTTICVPLMAQSVAIGALHFVIEKEASEEQYQKFITMADHLSLALSNINLRDSLKRQAIRDPLTNLYNRRYLDEAIENEIIRAERKQQSIGVLMIDIDHFKKFNDSFGHHAGDYTLQEVAKLMSEVVRADDIVSRYGGEEFLIVMPDTELDIVTKRAQLLVEKTRELTLNYKNKSLGHVTLSIGIAMYSEHGETSTSIISVADQALYKAKNEGRDQVQVADLNLLAKTGT
jgi:diguanylate cyclase (GGDEF)-like protein